MSTYFSYIDTALRVIYINRNSKQEENIKDGLSELLDQAETSQHIKQTILSKHLENQLKTDVGLSYVLVHEFHHYLQSLYYPFLYYINWLEFDNLIYLRNQIKLSKEEKFLIAQIQLTGKFLTNFTFTSQKFHLFWKNDRLLVKTPDEHTPSNETFSLYDFIEDATTLFQYKLTASSPNHEGFYEWIQNPSNKCYRRLYRFLVKQIGRKYTYDLLAIFVQVAFTTTEPISAFCNAVSFINYTLPDYDLYPPEEVFNIILDKLKSEWGIVDIDPVNDMFIQDLPTRVLTHENIQKVIEISNGNEDFLHFPLSLHAKKFINEVKQNPTLKYDLINIDGDKYTNLINTFHPLAIHYYFLERRGRDTALHLGHDFADGITPQGLPYDYYIKELIKIKEISQGLLTRIQKNIPGNCHHKACDYFDLGLCKKWNSIPKDYEDCGFPSWFTYIFHRKINLQTLTLDKVSIQEADNHWDDYNKRSFRKRKFNYIEITNGFSLTIGKEDFEHEEKTDMFPAFITFLINDKQKAKASLCSSITLDFYGFDNDPRPLFEIPEVKDWMLRTIKQVPEFLCYIDFMSKVNHYFILIPALVKHKLIASDKNGFSVEFDELDYKRFIKEQLSIFTEFIAQNKNTNPTTLINSFNILMYGNQN